MPFQLPHTSNYAISSNTCPQTAPILRTYICISINRHAKRGKKGNRAKFPSILVNQTDASAIPWTSRFQPQASSRDRASYSGGVPPAAASCEPLQLQSRAREGSSPGRRGPQRRPPRPPAACASCSSRRRTRTWPLPC
jgi:hypothetical protein